MRGGGARTTDARRAIFLRRPGERLDPYAVSWRSGIRPVAFLTMSAGGVPAQGRDDGSIFRAARSVPLTTSPPSLAELFEVAVADVDGAAGIAVIDIDGKPKRVADALFQRHRVGVFHLAAARLLPFANRHALDMRQRLGLTDVEAFLDD